MLEVLHEAAAGPLERDGEDALTVCESFGVLQGAVPKERVDRGKAHIAGGDAVVPVEFQVLKGTRGAGWGPRSSRSSWMTDRRVWVATKRSKSTRLSR